MTKREFIRRIAKNVGITQPQAKDVINTALNILTDELTTGDPIKIQGFGTLFVRERTHTGHDFITGETCPAHVRKYICFTPSEALKERINQ